MTNKKDLTVRELLNVDGVGDKDFSPLDINTSEIRTLSGAMPKDGNIDLNNAEILATKYLRGADICAELTAIAVAYVQKTDTLKKKAYSIAALENAENYFAGKKPDKMTDKMRMLYADMDEAFLKASENYNQAMAFAKWINGKHESFIRIHYLCRKILDRGYANEKASSWNTTDLSEEEVQKEEEPEKISKKDEDFEW
jgi:hypothetical protein